MVIINIESEIEYKNELKKFHDIFNKIYSGIEYHSNSDFYKDFDLLIYPLNKYNYTFIIEFYISIINYYIKENIKKSSIVNSIYNEIQKLHNLILKINITILNNMISIFSDDAKSHIETFNTFYLNKYNLLNSDYIKLYGIEIINDTSIINFYKKKVYLQLDDILLYIVYLENIYKTYLSNLFTKINSYNINSKISLDIHSNKIEYFNKIYYDLHHSFTKYNELRISNFISAISKKIKQIKINVERNTMINEMDIKNLNNNDIYLIKLFDNSIDLYEKFNKNIIFTIHEIIYYERIKRLYVEIYEENNEKQIQSIKYKYNEQQRFNIFYNNNKDILDKIIKNITDYLKEIDNIYIELQNKADILSSDDPKLEEFCGIVYNLKNYKIRDGYNYSYSIKIANIYKFYMGYDLYTYMGVNIDQIINKYEIFIDKISDISGINPYTHFDIEMRSIKDYFETEMKYYLLELIVPFLSEINSSYDYIILHGGVAFTYHFDKNYLYNNETQEKVINKIKELEIVKTYYEKCQHKLKIHIDPDEYTYDNYIKYMHKLINNFKSNDIDVNFYGDLMKLYSDLNNKIKKIMEFSRPYLLGKFNSLVNRFAHKFNFEMKDFILDEKSRIRLVRTYRVDAITKNKVSYLGLQLGYCVLNVMEPMLVNDVIHNNIINGELYNNRPPILDLDSLTLDSQKMINTFKPNDYKTPYCYPKFLKHIARINLIDIANEENKTIYKIIDKKYIYPNSEGLFDGQSYDDITNYLKIGKLIAYGTSRYANIINKILYIYGISLNEDIFIDNEEYMYFTDERIKDNEKDISFKESYNNLFNIMQNEIKEHNKENINLIRCSKICSFHGRTIDKYKINDIILNINFMSTSMESIMTHITNEMYTSQSSDMIIFIIKVPKQFIKFLFPGSKQQSEFVIMPGAKFKITKIEYQYLMQLNPDIQKKVIYMDMIEMYNIFLDEFKTEMYNIDRYYLTEEINKINFNISSEEKFIFTKDITDGGGQSNANIDIIKLLSYHIIPDIDANVKGFKVKFYGLGYTHNYIIPEYTLPFLPQYFKKSILKNAQIYEPPQYEISIIDILQPKINKYADEYINSKYFNTNNLDIYLNENLYETDTLFFELYKEKIEKMISYKINYKSNMVPMNMFQSNMISVVGGLYNNYKVIIYVFIIVLCILLLFNYKYIYINNMYRPPPITYY